MSGYLQVCRSPRYYLLYDIAQDRYCYISVTFHPSHYKEVPVLLISSQILRVGTLTFTPGLKTITNGEIFDWCLMAIQMWPLEVQRPCELYTLKE